MSTVPPESGSGPRLGSQIANRESTRTSTRARPATSHQSSWTFEAHPREPEPTPSSFAALTLAELLTGWLANAQHLHAPDTLEGCDDYCRQLEANHRLRTDAAALCERLRQRVSRLVDDESHDLTRVQNRLTPPG